MIDSIRTFLAVADAGSLSKVARDRGAAVSSISRKIDALEQELGFKLFNRTSRVVMLTDSGEHFLPRAKNIIAELDEARDSIISLNEEPRGLLTVTAPTSFGQRHVAKAIASFLKRYPLMEIELHLSNQIIELALQRYDVAIRVGSLPDSDLVATSLVPLRRLACASPEYIALHGKPGAPEDLLNHNCLTLTTKPFPTGWWCFAGINRDAALPIKGNFRTDDMNTLLQAALAGIGVAHLPTYLVSDQILSGELISLFPNIETTTAKPKRGIYAVRMPGRSHTAKAKLFIAHLKTEFGEPAYWDIALEKIFRPTHA